MFSGCPLTTEHRRWKRGSTETIKVLEGIASWEDCSNLCADWVSPQDEICVFWQHDINGASCFLKRGATSDQPQVDTTYYDNWNIGQCDPSSENWGEGVPKKT